MTNREYILGLLEDETFIDDDGSSYEAMLYYNIDCPYRGHGPRGKCNENLSEQQETLREICYRCKEEWLDSEVDE